MVVQGLLIEEPPSQTEIVSLARALESIEFPGFDHQFIVVDQFVANGCEHS